MKKIKIIRFPIGKTELTTWGFENLSTGDKLDFAYKHPNCGFKIIDCGTFFKKLNCGLIDVNNFSYYPIEVEE